MQDQLLIIILMLTAGVGLLHAVIWFVFVIKSMPQAKFFSMLPKNAQYLQVCIYATLMGPVLFNILPRPYMAPVVFIALAIFLYAKPRLITEYERAKRKADKSSRIQG